MIIDFLKKRRDRENLFSDISFASKVEKKCLQRTSRDLNLHRAHIKALRDQYRNDLNIEVLRALFMRFLKISEQQTITLKLYIRDLNDCQQAFVKRNNRERFLKTITCFSNVIIVRDYRKFHFIRLITNLKAAENKAKREIAKTARNLLNKQLT